MSEFLFWLLELFGELIVSLCFWKAADDRDWQDVVLLLVGAMIFCALTVLVVWLIMRPR